jgi:hypothetical protein
MSITVERLKELGLLAAGENLNKLQELERKCALAYENFRYVTPGKFEKFNKELRAHTYKRESSMEFFDILKFTKLEKYSEIPPADVLEALEKAQNLNCFDDFEIAKIESVKQIYDPILFGCVNGCPDRFFIAQWGNDVKIEDILSKDEG